jgi:hypothetical protein
MAIPYFEKNPDVAASYAKNTYGLTPEQFADTHYQLYGKAEQRAAPATIANVINTIGSNTATTANTANTVNTANTTVALPAYFAQNPDVAAAYKVNSYGLTPEQYAAEHFKLYGGTEQRANPTVVTAITSGNLTSLPKYFQDNPDVAKSYLLNTYGLTPDQFAAKHYELYGIKEQRVSPTGAPAIINKATTTSTTTGVTTPTTPTTPVGQFRDLFPSFAESKRIAAETVANRPSMQNIISMIQGKPTSTTPTYFQQNPDVAAAYLKNNYGMTPEQFALTHYQKFGQNELRTSPVTTNTALPTYFTQNPDVAASYLQNNYGLTPEQFATTHYQKFGQAEQRAAPTNLANVLSTIAK